MQEALAALLLITSTVIFACIVVDYATVVFQETLQTTNAPQLQRLKSLQNDILNQTDYMFNQTLPMLNSNMTFPIKPIPKQIDP